MQEVVFTADKFEGPLDLLLHLISKNKLNIVDISLAQITDQYFAYIKRWQNDNIEFSSEFLVVASELLYIKSKYLLPKHEEEEPSAEEQKQGLLARLKEYRTFRLCAQRMKERQFEGKYLFFRLAEALKFEKKPMDSMEKERLTAALFRLAERKAALRPPDKETVKEAFVQKPVSIFSKVKDILKTMKRKTKMKYRELFRGSRSERVASFLALLELIKLNRVVFADEGDELILTEERR